MKKRRLRLLLVCLAVVLALSVYRLASVPEQKPVPSVPGSPSAPEVPERTVPNPIVLIDPGHGGRDGGAVRAGIAEKDINLDIALRLRDILLAAGLVDVAMTRDTDIYVSGTGRVQVANQVKPALIVSIHVNSFDSTYVRGVETYYRVNSDESKDVALLLHETVLRTYRDSGHATLDRDIRPGSFRIIARPETRRAVLLEIGYLSNREERAIIVSQDFKVLLAQNLAETITRILDKRP